MIKIIDYLIFHLDCLYKRMDKFKYKDRGTEKFWLCVIMSMFTGLVLSSVDSIFFNNYLFLFNKYIYFLLYPILLLFFYYFFIKNERFLEYEFKESYKGYLLLFLLFIVMIVLMAMVKPMKY